MLQSEAFNEFQDVLEKYRQLLTVYSIGQLRQKPDPHHWSLGQILLHLSAETFDYGFLQIDQCLSSNRNINGKKTAEGEDFYKRGGFEDVKIKSPTQMQPAVHFTKRDLRSILSHAESKMKSYAEKISVASFQGKAEHPGLGYLDGAEWYFFITKHWVHHLRQVDRVEKFLMAAALNDRDAR
jgi:hypothetical protein